MENIDPDLPMRTFGLRASFLPLLTLLACACAVAPALGQGAHQAAPDAHAEPAPARADGPVAPDPAVEGLLTRLTGTYSNDTHTLNISPIAVTGLPRSAYVELTRTEAPLQPMAQQIWTFWTQGGKVRARVSEFSTGSTYGRVYIAAWAAPDSFAPITPDLLDAIADLEVGSADGSAALVSPHPGPVFRADAIHVEYDFKFDGHVLSWRCVGLGVDGRPVWGDETLKLTKGESKVRARVLEPGLVIIDLLIGEGPALAEGDSIAVQMDAYTLGGMHFYSTDNEPTGNFQTQVPSTQVPLIGWNKAVLGMQKGTVRRIIIPPWMGFDSKERPVQRPEFIPSNSWLIFDAHVLSLRDNTPEGAAKPAPVGEPAKPQPE